MPLDTDHQFIEAARNEGENKWWQYVITIIITVAGMALGSIPFMVYLGIAARVHNPELTELELETIVRSMDFSQLQLNSNLVLALMLLQFVFGLAFLYLSVRVIHKKDFLSLIRPTKRIRWNRMFWAFAVWFGISLISEGVSYGSNPENYIWNFQAGPFFLLLLLALTILPLQTSFEELLTRGYLLQGFGLLFKNRWVPILLTSILFGSLHLMNPEINEFGVGKMLTYYIGIGVFLAIITVMDDGLEIPMGIHAATNIFAATMVNFEGSALQTEALFYQKEVPLDGMLWGLGVITILFLLIAKRILGWGSWRKLI